MKKTEALWWFFGDEITYLGPKKNQGHWYEHGMGLLPAGKR